jgi:predicted CoA-binding protein
MRDYSDELIVKILKSVHVIAMVGASADPVRASHFVMKYLQSKGYRVIPVNPSIAGQTLLSERVYASLREIPDKVDMVDIFRPGPTVPPIVEDAIAIGAKVVWMQLGIVNEEAAKRAEQAGLTVIMNRCPKMEYGRLNGEMGWVGANSGVIDNRRRALAPSSAYITRDPIGKGKGTL